MFLSKLHEYTLIYAYEYMYSNVYKYTYMTIDE